ncbi:MAG: hypothetical protein WCF23_02725 [Candidatus Nitrosopolaris sp.]
MLSAIQANAVRFNDKETVVDKITAEVGKKWRTNWRNELIVEDKKTKEIQYDVVNYRRRTDEPIRPTRFYHITIHNRHYSIPQKIVGRILKAIEKHQEVSLAIFKLRNQLN